jgi:hypothetical protein
MFTRAINLTSFIISLMNSQLLEEFLWELMGGHSKQDILSVQVKHFIRHSVRYLFKKRLFKK